MKKWFETCLLAGACVALCLPETGCKTTSGTLSAGPAVAVTCQSLQSLGESFLTTGIIIDGAYDAHVLDVKAYLPWHDFSLRFVATFNLADKACVAAIKSNDQSVQGIIGAEMTTLRDQLEGFAALGVQLGAPDGGVQ